MNNDKDGLCDPHLLCEDSGLKSHSLVQIHLPHTNSQCHVTPERLWWGPSTTSHSTCMFRDKVQSSTPLSLNSLSLHVLSFEDSHSGILLGGCSSGRGEVPAGLLRS